MNIVLATLLTRKCKLLRRLQYYPTVLSVITEAQSKVARLQRHESMFILQILCALPLRHLAGLVFIDNRKHLLVCADIVFGRDLFIIRSYRPYKAVQKVFAFIEKRY